MYYIPAILDLGNVGMSLLMRIYIKGPSAAEFHVNVVG